MNFAQALAIAGLMPRDVIADGKWRRCPTLDKPRKRNGAYKLTADGVGLYRNWAVDDEVQVWRDESDARPIDEARIRAQREKERQARIVAMRGAREFWNGCASMLALHPYLARKRLSALGCAGLRVNRDLLVVPVWHGQWVVSVQTITADGQKRFWPGAPVKAGAFVLDRPRYAVTAVCEGLATGLAIYQSVRQARVVVAFDAGNLAPVVDRIKPTGSVVICADNDHETQARIGTNPGIEKARNAAELAGCGVAYPDGIAGTDWADALLEYGEMPQRRVERQILAQARYVPP